MKQYGISSEIVRWVGNWLTGRRQRVLIEGVVSGWEMVRSEVPQGSVLGPVRYVVFIDDIEENIHSTELKFADNTKVGARVETEEDREVLRGDEVGLFGWSQNWPMLFNLDKCAVMHFVFNNIGESMELVRKLLV